MSQVVAQALQSNWRTGFLAFQVLIGLVAVAGSAYFVLAGAGMFGSPFQGDPYFNLTLLMVVMFGPAMILPSALLDVWKPGWGGIFLCTTTILEGIGLMLNNFYEIGYNAYNVATAGVFLVVPMFALGSCLVVTGPRNSPKRLVVWFLKRSCFQFSQFTLRLLALVFGHGRIDRCGAWKRLPLDGWPDIQVQVNAGDRRSECFTPW